MHLGIKNFVGGVRKWLFGDGSYSQNVIQGGSVLQPQASYTFDQMPTATGATTAGWVFSASSEYSASLAAWKAADGIIGVNASNDYNWCMQAYVNTGWWQAKAPVAVDIDSYSIQAVDIPGYCPAAWTLRGSNTGAFAGEETILDTRSGITSWTDREKKTFTLPGGVAKFLYYRFVFTAGVGNTIQITEFQLLRTVQNAVVVTGAATVAPDGTTGASVFTCDALVVDGGTLTPSTNSKGLLGFVKSGVYVLNGGKLNIDRLGKAGNFGNLTVLDLVPASLKRKLKSSLASYVALGEGAAGGARSAASTGSTAITGNTGSLASAMQTGGGGGGGAQNGNSGGSTTGGAGGKGGPCCGGAGGAAGLGNVPGNDAGPYGGPGANAVPAWIANQAIGGGAGDPPGTNSASSGASITPTAGAGGGLLMLFTPLLYIASGCIVSADGSPGVNVSGTYTAAGSGAGGGCVALITNTGGLSNAGTVRASGGAPGTGNTYCTPGAGGAGSVNIFTIN